MMIRPLSLENVHFSFLETCPSMSFDNGHLFLSPSFGPACRLVLLICDAHANIHLCVRFFVQYASFRAFHVAMFIFASLSIGISIAVDAAIGHDHLVMRAVVESLFFSCL
jgi:hypothetical protein